jgi:hypothetical protein
MAHQPLPMLAKTGAWAHSPSGNILRSFHLRLSQSLGKLNLFRDGVDLILILEEVINFDMLKDVSFDSHANNIAGFPEIRFGKSILVSSWGRPQKVRS